MKSDFRCKHVIENLVKYGMETLSFFPSLLSFLAALMESKLSSHISPLEKWKDEIGE